MVSPIISILFPRKSHNHTSHYPFHWRLHRGWHSAPEVEFTGKTLSHESLKMASVTSEGNKWGLLLSFSTVANHRAYQWKERQTSVLRQVVVNIPCSIKSSVKITYLRLDTCGQHRKLQTEGPRRGSSLSWHVSLENVVFWGGNQILKFCTSFFLCLKSCLSFLDKVNKLLMGQCHLYSCDERKQRTGKRW